MTYVFKKDNARKIHKFGVDITLYDTDASSGVVYEEVEKGHLQEWYSDVSTYQWFIIEGSGTYVIDGEKHDVTQGDLVVVPPGHRMYYYGTMKMVLVTTPKFDPAHEHEARVIDESEF